MFFIAYAFKGHVHAFAGRVKVVSHSSCRTSAILKYFCPLKGTVKPVFKLNSHSKIDITKILMTNGSLMKVESIAECSKGSILQYF